MAGRVDRARAFPIPIATASTESLPKLLRSTKLVLNEPYQQIYLAIGELPAERSHAVSALGNVSIDLLVGRIFEFALSKIRDSPAIIQRLPFSLGSVADRTILTKQRGFVSFAFGDHVTLLFTAAAC
ncbi:hypothetical protein BH18ACI3_BH18ACI3_18040 [soil metagenome]